MRWIDADPASAAESLALDVALLAAGEECLRLWEPPAHCVVLGRFGRMAEEVDRAACEAAGVPILRRESGGGTVLLGPGCLVLSLVLSLARRPHLLDVRRSQRWIGGRIAEALGIGEPAGDSDLALDGRKFSGSAQRRTATALLHHATLCYELDLPLVARLLPVPRRQPAYRAGRSHADFLTNLPLGPAELRQRLAGLTPAGEEPRHPGGAATASSSTT